MRLLTITMNPSIDISTTVAKISSPEKLRCTRPAYDPGGGGINVARVVKRLAETKVTAFFLSGGSNGTFLEELLAKEQLAYHVIHEPARTRESFTVIEQTSGEQFRFVLPGAEVHESSWRVCLNALAELIPKHDFVVASGSLPPGVPPDFYAQLARLAQQAQVRFVLDTSGPPLQLALAVGVYLIKPNHNELQALAAADGVPIAGYAQALVAAHKSEIVAHTLGAQGVLLISEAGEWRFAAPDVEVKSTVGAGDSFLGGMILGLMQGRSLTESCQLGLAAAAATLMSPGTGLCHAEDVKRFFNAMK